MLPRSTAFSRLRSPDAGSKFRTGTEMPSTSATQACPSSRGNSGVLLGSPESYAHPSLSANVAGSGSPVATLNQSPLPIAVPIAVHEATQVSETASPGETEGPSRHAGPEPRVRDPTARADITIHPAVRTWAVTRIAERRRIGASITSRSALIGGTARRATLTDTSRDPCPIPSPARGDRSIGQLAEIRARRSAVRRSRPNHPR